MDKNIYTILEEIEFEKRIKSLCRSTKADEFLLQQGVFSIIQSFYENILDSHKPEVKKIPEVKSSDSSQH